MEVTKESFLNNDILEVEQEKGIFKRHKFIKIFIAVSVISTIANLFLIHKFFEVLFLEM